MSKGRPRPDNYWPMGGFRYVPWDEWCARRPTWRDKNPPVGLCVGCGLPAATEFDGLVLHPCCVAPNQTKEEP